MQGVIQKYIDHGISSTINMPVGTTVEQGQELYHAAWQHGLKGVTIYVDGSRSGVLVTNSDARKPEKPVADRAGHASIGAEKNHHRQIEVERLPDVGVAGIESLPAGVSANSEVTTAETASGRPAKLSRMPRPRKLSGLTYKVQTPVGEAYVTVNDGSSGAFELFVNIAKAGSTVAADAEAIGRLCSLVLRLPSPYTRTEVVRQIVRQLEGIGGERSTGFGARRVRSIADAVAHVLSEHCDLTSAHYSGVDGGPTPRTEGPQPGGNEPSSNLRNIPVGDLCPECGHATYIAEAGCHKCHSCGFTEC
jgi:ribonucleoside-diphosphate reductase alpha chain